MKEKLQQIMDDAGITVKSEYARRIGVSAGNVGDWLKGRSSPNTDMVRRLYEEFDVNPLWLVCDVGEAYVNQDAALRETNKLKTHISDLNHLISRLKGQIDYLEQDKTVYRQALSRVNTDRDCLIEKVVPSLEKIRAELGQLECAKCEHNKGRI